MYLSEKHPFLACVNFHANNQQGNEKKMNNILFYILYIYFFTICHYSPIDITLKITPYIVNFCGRAIAVTFKLRSSDSRRCCAWKLFSQKLFQSSRYNGHGAYIPLCYFSPSDGRYTPVVYKGKRPRVAGCIPSVVLTNVRPKIRLTGPGPAFTSPPLQRSPAPFLRVSRSSLVRIQFQHLHPQPDPARRTIAEPIRNLRQMKTLRGAETLLSLLKVRIIWESTHANDERLPRRGSFHFVKLGKR